MDDPVGRGLAGFRCHGGRNNAAAAMDLFGGHQHGEHARAGDARFDQLRRSVRSDRCRFTTTTALDVTDVFDHPNLTEGQILYNPH
ncbi:hypothetical protein D3C85_1055970 [compost metagenome]